MRRILLLSLVVPGILAAQVNRATTSRAIPAGAIPGSAALSGDYTLYLRLERVP